MTPELERRLLADQSARHESSSEHIVRDVIRGLYKGRYEPGERLLESQIMTRYGVSRGPVREALNRLVAMGVVQLSLQRGAKVRRLTIGEAIDILVVAQSLVGVAARLAAQRISVSGAMDQLRSTFENLSRFQSSSGAAEYAIARDSFYSAIRTAANNAELSRVLPIVQIHLVRVQFRAILKSVDGRRHGDYKAIMMAILAADAKVAERAAHEHIGRSIKALQAFRLSDT